MHKAETSAEKEINNAYTIGMSVIPLMHEPSVTDQGKAKQELWKVQLH